MRSSRADETAAAEGGAEPPSRARRSCARSSRRRSRSVRVEDVVLQSVVSILNLSARRIAKDDERDLDQAKVGIDAARASSTW